MQQDTSENSPSEIKQSTESWLACGLGRDARGRQSKWESGHGKQNVTVNSINLCAIPHLLHTLSMCVRACVCPPIYLESCDWTQAVMHTVWKAQLYIVGQCWVSQWSIVGAQSSLFPEKRHVIHLCNVSVFSFRGCTSPLVLPIISCSALIRTEGAHDVLTANFKYYLRA